LRAVYDSLVRSAKTFYGWTVFAGACTLWALTVIPVTLLVARFRPTARGWFRDATRAALHTYIGSLPFMRVRLERLEGVPECGANGARARILVANHQSWLDPIILLSIEPRLSGPARSYVHRWPAVGSIMRLAGFYPSDEAGPALLDRMRDGVEQALAGGDTLLFFPEGTRSRDGEIGPFRRGAFRMAAEYGLAIQPVVIDGMHRVLPPGSPFVQTRGRPEVRVRYLDPVLPSAGTDHRRTAVRALTERVRASMVGELERMRSEAAGEVA
jgi:1-acyl-sn-glycerol-3-phosphate acyltransferase